MYVARRCLCCDIDDIPDQTAGLVVGGEDGFNIFVVFQNIRCQRTVFGSQKQRSVDLLILLLFPRIIRPSRIKKARDQKAEAQDHADDRAEGQTFKKRTGHFSTSRNQLPFEKARGRKYRSKIGVVMFIMSTGNTIA